MVKKLIEKLPLLRKMERRKLVNYIISTAKNTAYNYLRNQKPEFLLEEQKQFPAPASMPEEHVIAQEGLLALAQAWPGLDGRTRYLLHSEKERPEDRPCPEHAAGQCAGGAGADRT